MPVKVITTGTILVIMLSIVVQLIEFFIPLSAKSSMNLICRNTMLSMELEGGLSGSIEAALKEELEAGGFRDIEISGTTDAELGGEMFLNVDADFHYSRLNGIFSRGLNVQRMSYSRTMICRRIIK